MFRNNKFPKEVTTINVLLGDGGAGDIIASLVAVNYIINNYPWVNPLIWVPDFLLDFAKHVLPKQATIRNYTTASKKYNPNLTGISTKWMSQHTPMRTHPVDYAYHMLADIHLYGETEHRNYLKIRENEIDVSRFNLPNNYAVVCPLSVERVKRFHPVVINQISDYLNSNNIVPVYLGKEVMNDGKTPEKKASITPANYEKGINLLNQTTILETTAIMSKAKVVITMDGGTVHMAGCTDTPIIAGYTFINPEHNMPIRNNKLGYNVYPIVPDSSLECRFCQSNWGLLYNVDFRECRYGDYACVDYITFDKIKQELDKIL